MRFRFLLLCIATLPLLATAEGPETDPDKTLSQEEAPNRDFSGAMAINYRDKQHGWRTATLTIHSDNWAHNRVLVVHGDIVVEGVTIRPVEITEAKEPEDGKDAEVVATGNYTAPGPQVFYTVRSLNFKSESGDPGDHRCTRTYLHDGWTDFWSSYSLLWQLGQEIAVTLDPQGGLVLTSAAEGPSALSQADTALVESAQACLLRACEFAFVDLDIAHCPPQEFLYQALPHIEAQPCTIEISQASADDNVIEATYGLKTETMTVSGNATWDRRAGLDCIVKEVITLKGYSFGESGNPWGIPKDCEITLDVKTSGPR